MNLTIIHRVLYYMSMCYLNILIKGENYEKENQVHREKILHQQYS